VKNDRLSALLQHRARLVGRARVERDHLAATVVQIESSLSWLDMVKRAGTEVRSHPLGVLAVLAILAVIRPRGALKLLGSGWWLWRFYQRFRRVWTLAAGIVASRTATRA
jgi:hypothetical protein